MLTDLQESIDDLRTSAKIDLKKSSPTKAVLRGHTRQYRLTSIEETRKSRTRKHKVSRRGIIKQKQ